MFSIKTCLVSALSLSLLFSTAFAADNGHVAEAKGPLAKIKWLKGPAQASLGDVADLQVQDGFMLANAADTQKIMELLDNPTSGSELGLLMPTNGSWFVIFSFAKTGYIKDDDKDKLDAEAMLKSITAATEAANETRKKKGSPVLNIIGWEQVPKYNPETHNLEWAIRGESEGRPVINYNTRLLGRKGVMEVKLVIKPDKLAETMPAYQLTLQDYSFKPGEKYAEYRQGDKIAKYGLAALVTGGAAVVAVKSGLFTILLVALKKLWVLIVAGVAGIINFFKRLFGGGKKPPTSAESPPSP